MGEFIQIEIDGLSCFGMSDCGNCVRVCPVNIFEVDGEQPSIIRANEDECTLCELCLQACKICAISIRKLYEL